MSIFDPGFGFYPIMIFIVDFSIFKNPDPIGPNPDVTLNDFDTRGQYFSIAMSIIMGVRKKTYTEKINVFRRFVPFQIIYVDRGTSREFKTSTNLIANKSSVARLI